MIYSTVILIIAHILLAHSVSSAKVYCNATTQINGSSTYKFGGRYSHSTPQVFQPYNNQSCYFKIVVPAGSYAILKINGSMTSKDNYSISDSANVFTYSEQLKNIFRTYNLPAGDNKLYINTPSGSYFNSTLGFDVRYFKLNSTSGGSTNLFVGKNMKPVILFEHTNNNVISIITSMSMSTIVASVVSSTQDPFAGTSYLVYKSDGTPLGSLFFYDIQGLMFNSNGEKEITICNFPTSDLIEEVVVNALENVQRFNDKYKIISMPSTFNQPLTLDATNGPVAISVFSFFPQNEYLTSAAFSSNSTRLTIEAGGPTADKVFALSQYSSLSIANAVPQRVNGYLNTYIAENGTITIQLISLDQRVDVAYKTLITGQRRFYTSPTYPFAIDYGFDSCYFSATSRVKITVSSENIFFNTTSNSSRYVEYKILDGGNLVASHFDNYTESKSSNVLVGNGDALSIVYIDADGAESGVFLALQIDQPDPSLETTTHEGGISTETTTRIASRSGSYFVTFLVATIIRVYFST